MTGIAQSGIIPAFLSTSNKPHHISWPHPMFHNYRVVLLILLKPAPSPLEYQLCCVNVNVCVFLAYFSHIHMPPSYASVSFFFSFFFIFSSKLLFYTIILNS